MVFILDVSGNSFAAKRRTLHHFVHDCPQSKILCLCFLQHIFDNPAIGELHAGTGAIG
jgi:hypothetical protein